MTSKRDSKNKKPWFDRGDVGLGVFLVTVTAGSLVLPIDAYMNPTRYSPPEMVFSRQQPGAEDHLAYMAGGRALYDLKEERFLPANQLSSVDQITTGTVASDPVKAERTPMPSVVANDVQLLAGDKRRAMIMNDDGIYIVSNKSRLPGGARVRALIQKDGKSRLITNRYVVLRAE